MIAKYKPKIQVKIEGEELSPLQFDATDDGKFLEALEILHENGLAIEDRIFCDYASPLKLLKQAIDAENTEMVAFLERHGYHV